MYCQIKTYWFYNITHSVPTVTICITSVLALGSEVVNTRCHICSEKWAHLHLFIKKKSIRNVLMKAEGTTIHCSTAAQCSYPISNTLTSARKRFEMKCMVYLKMWEIYYKKHNSVFFLNHSNNKMSIPG